MKIVATIEARMTSSRLPGKILMPILGKPALQWIVERVKKSRYIDEVVVATTTNKTDDPTVELCKKIGVKYYRGSEYDVLDRVLNAARENQADLICELMGDSPMLDPVLIDQAITAHLAADCDYTANFYPENYLPLGFAAQVFSLSVLEKVASLTSDPVDRVHVSCFIYHNPKIFRLNGVAVNSALTGADLRLCVDTKEDFEVVKKVFEALAPANPDFGAKEAIKFMRNNPDLALINSKVRKKSLEEG